MSNEDEDEIGVIIKVQLDADTEATIFAETAKEGIEELKKLLKEFESK